MDSVLNTIFADVAKQTGQPVEKVRLIYHEMFRFIFETQNQLDLFNYTDEEFKAAKTNFNIPRIMKIYSTKNRVDYVKAKIRENNSKHEQGVNADDNPEGCEEE